MKWKVIQYNDTAVFRLAKHTAIIDSVVDLANQEVFYPEHETQFNLPASKLVPGINELSFNFYSEGKRKRYQETLYMVSDTVPSKVVIDDYNILKHDKHAFTQGLIFWKGMLYESTGLVGQSSLRIINPDNGDLIRKIELDSTIFGEGLAAFNNELQLLTWKDGVLYRFNENLKHLGIHPYRQEGWGLTNFNGKLLASDGSNKLYYLSNSYKVDSIIQVFNHRGPVHYLNELEYIKGKIWANVLADDKIIVINPRNGKIEVEIDASNCINRHHYPEAGVLNGIAFDKANDNIYLTGKNWPYIIVWRYMSFDKSNN
jgi:glutamine cyclotransferase